MIDNAAIVIRSIGERTTNICRQLLCQQVEARNIVVISERPFTRALHKSFEIGIEFGLQWTICVDADILIRRNAIQTLVDWAQPLNSDVFQVQANLLDKFLCRSRIAGPRIYRTSLLARALSYIPADGVTLIPEAYAIKRMASQGYPYVHKNFTLGLHDFEQYYRDIPRKIKQHLQRDVRYILEIRPTWRRRGMQDPDYQVALWAVDNRRDTEDLDTLLHSQGWQEKEELDTTSGTSESVDNLIFGYIHPLLLRTGDDASANTAQPVP